MPTYEYACTSCGHHLEVRQRITENPLTECPECHEPELRKLLSSAGSFVLKGGGWFRDGYASSSERKSDSPAGDSDSSGASQNKRESTAESTATESRN